MSKLTPELIAMKRDRARRCMEKGDSARAASILGELADKGLSDPVFFTELANALHAEADFPAVEACLARFLRIHPGSADAHRFAAELLYRMRRPDAALRAYLTPTASEDSAGHCRLGAAGLLERQGKPDAARELAAAVLREEPGSEPARRLLATLHPKNEDKIAALSDLLAGDTRERETRWRAGHALSAALDAAGDYPGAFRALAATKARMEIDFADEIVRCRELYARRSAAIREQMLRITPDHLRRWRDAAAGLPPVRAALLAGHPRSGTTLLESILDAHSGLVSVEETECMESCVNRAVFKGSPTVELFDVGFLDQLPVDTVKKARAGYAKALAQFPVTPPGDRLLLDKNPILTHFLGAALRFFPGMKLVVALRDPREVCLSCHRQPVGVNPTNVPWLRIDDTMRAYNDIMGVWLRLRDLLPADDFLEVRYERLVADTAGTARDTLGFLGLPWEDATLDYHRPENRRTIFSPTYAQAAKPVYKNALRHWENYAGFLAPHLGILDPAVAAFGYA